VIPLWARVFPFFHGESQATKPRANTERSYADRLQRGRELHAASSGFTPGFAPVDGSLEPDAFEEFLDGLDTLNNAVVTAVSGWQDSAGSRSELVTEIKARALRASSRVKSNTAWKAKLPQVKGRQQGDQSFGDIKVLLDKLIAALGTVPGYDTSAPADISIAGLQALSTQLDGLNKLVAGREQALASARSPRKEGYDGENGLSEKMKAIKEATKSQYGSQSPQFLQVKGIRV